MKDTHIFFHLERSGGRTMKDILTRQYDNIFDIRQSKDYEPRLRDLRAMRQDKQRGIKLIQGHQYYGIHKELLQDSTYFCLLRNPVEKVISAYQSYRRTKDSPNHYWAMTYTLKEALEQGHKLHFDNGYTRALAFENKEQEVPYGDLTKEHFEKAKFNLFGESFLCAPVDRYDEFLVYLHHKLNWRSIPFYSKANFAKKQHLVNVDKKTISLIKKMNKYDQNLYDGVKWLFALEVQSVPNFKQRVFAFNLLNSTLGKAYIGQRLKRLIERKFG